MQNFYSITLKLLYMSEMWYSEVQSYLKERGFDIPIDKIREIFNKYYSNAEITANSEVLASVATISHILGRDVIKDIKRFYYTDLLFNWMGTLMFLRMPYPVEYTMGVTICKRFHKFVSIYKRLFIGNLTKDLGFNHENFTARRKNKICIIINNEGKEEFAFALAYKLGSLTRWCIRVDKIYGDFGYIPSLPTILFSLGCTKSHDSFEEESFEGKEIKRIEIDRNHKIKLYDKNGLVGNYVARKEGKQLVIKKVRV